MLMNLVLSLLLLSLIISLPLPYGKVKRIQCHDLVPNRVWEIDLCRKHRKTFLMHLRNHDIDFEVSLVDKGVCCEMCGAI